MSQKPLIIALSKGRILKDTLPLLKEAGIEMTEDPSASRKLIFDTTREDVKIIVIRATDVPPYVQHGGADIGVAGKDVLMEHGAEGLFEPLDLEIARCKLMVAALKDAPPVSGRLRVATKFVNVAKSYFAQQGRQAEVIKLYGAMELAPLVGLADRIVDIVDTGNTLRANGLEPTEMIATISSRVVVNRASMKTRHSQIQEILDQVAKAVAARREQ
ncbi:ATP phosphoribosyltransferase [Alloalcanivorax xenomutans]|jgi:ATP phosphoribosyltransferase|uniref:ATP phosphoribosyltransferase n=1 Tax=Alloalcanivorax xenomutans TaxID=1094342 RepID=A0A9Q3ZDR9_9GAMM|nr:ATP phosphoribosyltransferase [Alloalcanivorax xenomutans]ERS11902.1 ATP phosphoribosyltransferase [Alcanivorax sp. PN-3]MBA4720488.1 ATP phosphoribosyltransferase [Alcanivorax sp.]ARB46865.1 ATP phosphoribosyltransferase catalytic subunit [Alloalcanivorax xenomutans]MCE7510058.1 ATP phosphoribosyltransferase [Alloalcanivorax xenomutans]MCE7525530.1 ATP phosphoribosyltransferase [Alloalcanivorax xenomutans]|tara:strand:+ start:147 stop:794 length:648 start_codon:yes stop_codon:yes gene_type:complete